MIILRSRNFALELYPEDNTHCDVLDYIISYFDYAYILHDKDVFDEDVIDGVGNLVHKKGDLKKPHWHVIISFKNARSDLKVKEELGIKHIESCNFYIYSRYLIHLDSPKKYQYNREDINTNMQMRIYNALERDYNFSEQETRLLYKYITERNFVTFRQLTDYAMENDLLLELKRNVYFYKQFCDESGYRRW